MNKSTNNKLNRVEILPGIFIEDKGVKSRSGNYNIKYCSPGGRNYIGDIIYEIYEKFLFDNKGFRHRSKVEWCKNGITGVCLYIPWEDEWTPEPTFVSIIKNGTDVYHFEGHFATGMTDDKTDDMAKDFKSALNSLLKDIQDFEFVVWLMKSLDYGWYQINKDGTVDFGAAWNHNTGLHCYTNVVTIKKTDTGFKALAVKEVGGNKGY